MSTQTSKYGFTKPDLTDVADITLYNENWDKVEEELSELLPLAGGTLRGSVDVNNGYGRVIALNTQAQVESRNIPGDASNRRVINVRNSNSGIDLKHSLSLLDIVNNTTTTHHIYGTHNKPNNTYTGNGSATSRTIDTGGIGGVCIIHTSNGIAIVTSSGAMFVKTSGASFNVAATFKNGVLTIATADSIINASGTTYNYQVL